MVHTILVSGSSGLIGSEVARHFDQLGWQVHGIDNNQRAVFFGPAGDTRWNQERLSATLRSFTHHELDLRDREGILRLVASIKPDKGQPTVLAKPAIRVIPVIGRRASFPYMPAKVAKAAS